MLTRTTRYGRAAHATLAEVVADAKAGDALAPVTIIVRDNIAAISVRRALARGVGGMPGIAAVNAITLSRLAEQVLAAAGDAKPPASSAMLTALWRRELMREPGVFGPVAGHPSTVRALVRAHRELREVGSVELESIEQSSALAADLVRLHLSVSEASLDGRRDEVLVLRDAANLVRAYGVPDGIGVVVVHLPAELSPSEREMLEALQAADEAVVVVGCTGNVDVDAGAAEALHLPKALVADSPAEEALADRVLHASDADDEVREVIREVRTILAGGVDAHRIAILHPSAVPYARLLHDHLAAAGIRANGPGVRPLRDRAIADSFLTLLRLEPDDLGRVALFDWLSRAPIRLGDGAASVPRTRWERLSREAGVTSGDWLERLADHEARHQARLEADRDNPDVSERSIAFRERTVAESQEFAAFIVELRSRLLEGRALTSWASLGEWALGAFHRYLGRSDAMGRLPEDEQRAATAIENTLSAVAELDRIGTSPTLGEVVEILDVDLDARKPRVGRFGEGIFVGTIASAPSLDVEHVFVLGLAEDLYPGRQSIDPLLPDSVRVLAGGALPTARDRLRRMHHAILAGFDAGAHVTASFPRGDLRRGAERLPSRWLMPTLRNLTETPDLEATHWAEASALDFRSIASHWDGVTRAVSPATAQEWRLQRLAGGENFAADSALDAALAMIRARHEDAFTRFDGNLEGVDGLPDYRGGEVLVSPTALERYASCPHAFFVERMLGVSPLESPEEIIALRASDLGTIVHTVMDRLVLESDELPGYGEPWSPGHRERMRSIAEDVMDDFERRGLTGHPRLWEREREQLRRDLEHILDLDDAAHADRGSRVVASELAFGMRGKASVKVDVDGGTIAMRGSADRVDETRDGALIVTDFKTGSSRGFADIPRDPVVGGTKLQLPLYAHAARVAFGARPVEAGYWFIGRRDRGKRIDVVLDDRLEHTYRRALGTLTGSIRDGLFIARPPDSPDFLWVQCAFCNPDGVGYGHIAGPSERKRTDAALADLYALLDPSVLPVSSVQEADTEEVDG